jgi:PAS domain-containing protein
LSKPIVPIIHSLRDPACQAIVKSSTPLFYREGADSECDRPAHVRAGSSLSWFGNQLAVVQDDSNFLVLIDPYNFEVEAITLPAGELGLRQFDDQRGNKQFKLDLEACTTVPTTNGDLFLAFGSGSTARREQILIVRESEPSSFILQSAKTLYTTLRNHTEFSGSELNIEGALFQHGKIRLFNRGNGSRQGILLPVNATGDLDWEELSAYLKNPDSRQPPSLQNICQYDLGSLNGLRLSFTDATVTQRGIIFSSTAEASPDVTSDGIVTGSALGILDANPRWVEIRNTDGSLFKGKVEGVCPFKERENGLFVVVDADEPTSPCELCEIELLGNW